MEESSPDWGLWARGVADGASQPWSEISGPEGEWDFRGQGGVIAGEGNKVGAVAGSGLLAPGAGDKPEEEEARSCECRNGRGGGRESRG